MLPGPRHAERKSQGGSTHDNTCSPGSTAKRDEQGTMHAWLHHDPATGTWMLADPLTGSKGAITSCSRAAAGPTLPSPAFLARRLPASARSASRTSTSISLPTTGFNASKSHPFKSRRLPFPRSQHQPPPSPFHPASNISTLPNNPSSPPAAPLRLRQKVQQRSTAFDTFPTTNARAGLGLLVPRAQLSAAEDIAQVCVSCSREALLDRLVLGDVPGLGPGIDPRFPAFSSRLCCPWNSR